MIEHEYTIEVVCPYCGYEFIDSWEFSDDGEQECYGCGKEFYFSRNVEVTYSTDKACKCIGGCRSNKYTSFCLCRICPSGKSGYQSEIGKHCDEGLRDDCKNKDKKQPEFESWGPKEQA